MSGDSIICVIIFMYGNELPVTIFFLVYHLLLCTLDLCKLRIDSTPRNKLIGMNLDTLCACT